MRRGQVVIERFESAVLKGNPAGDPARRDIPVYLPPAYATDPTRRFPVVYVLTGYTGRGRMLLNDNPWSPSLDDRLDALLDGGRMGETIVVMPDAFTRYGGSQYMDSGATGRYGTHIAEELVSHVDRTYRTMPGAAHRGVVGKSSGGYGALSLAMRHPGVFGAVACHSGDMYFEYCYLPDVPRFAAEVMREGGILPWFGAFQAKRQKKHEDLELLNILAMAAAYSPDPAEPLGIALPVDLETGRFRDDVWRRWLESDPLRMVERHADALRGLKLLFLDCGSRDEFHLHIGLGLMTRRLTDLGIAHESERYDDGHMNVSYRYDVSLPKIAAALGAKK
jgi:enterochelin esterase family protein